MGQILEIILRSSQQDVFLWTVCKVDNRRRVLDDFHGPVDWTRGRLELLVSETQKIEWNRFVREKKEFGFGTTTFGMMPKIGKKRGSR